MKKPLKTLSERMTVPKEEGGRGKIVMVSLP